MQSSEPRHTSGSADTKTTGGANKGAKARRSGAQPTRGAKPKRGAARRTTASDDGGTTRKRSSPSVSEGAAAPRSKREAVGAPAEPLRYAVVGLGHIAQSAVLPAFAHASKYAELAALVTQDRSKLEALGKQYDVEALYDYSELRRCLREESIDAIYIATPNSEHHELALEAADAGVHVLCEKPLAVTERECIDMIRACERAGVLLMTAYRLHFEAANLEALETIHSGKIGEPRIFSSVFSFQIADPENIRLRPDLGGGPLHDIGIYCINAARSVFRAEPIEVQAWALNSGDPRFRDIEETVTAQMRFTHDRVATFTCSYGAAEAGWYQVVGTKGDICVDPAYEYTEGLETHLTVGKKTRRKRHPKRDQFAAELIYFSRCIVEGVEPEPSGWEGLADVRTIRALQQSIDRGCPLELPPSTHVRHPSPRQRIDSPPVAKPPKLINARPASE